MFFHEIVDVFLSVLQNCVVPHPRTLSEAPNSTIGFIIDMSFKWLEHRISFTDSTINQIQKTYS